MNRNVRNTLCYFSGKNPQNILRKFKRQAFLLKLDTSWLKQCGFTSGNDSYILPIFKFIGFVDDAKNPTSLWKAYKSPSDARAVLAKGIREGYEDLFNLYPDANHKERETLYAYFSSKTGKAKRTLELITTTFTNLCKLADFEADAPKDSEKGAKVEKDADNEEEGKGETKKQMTPQVPDGFAVNMNIQITLPITEDAKVYENIFKALREQLFKSD